MLALGQRGKAPLGPVAHDRPQPRQVRQAIAHELAAGRDVVRSGRAGRGGDGQSQDLDEQRALGADRAATPATGLDGTSGRSGLLWPSGRRS